MVQRTAAPEIVGPPSLLELELDQVLAEIGAAKVVGANSAQTMADLMARFVSHARRVARISSLAEVCPDAVLDFLRARTTDGSAPAVGTMHLRRSAVRLLFRIARMRGLCGHDPTLDISLPPRSVLGVRPLGDDEVALCRSHSIETLKETRQPAAWALAEATATTTELSHLRLSDLDLQNERVWLHSGRSTTSRWGYLSPWGLVQLDRRARVLACKAGTDPVLVYDGKGSTHTATISGCVAISGTLRRAGLSAEPDVRPSSVRAWAGAVILRDTGSIEKVARRLGMRSLDRAARFIGHEWNLAHKDSG